MKAGSSDSAIQSNARLMAAVAGEMNERSVSCMFSKDSPEATPEPIEVLSKESKGIRLP